MILFPYPDSYRTVQIFDDVLLGDQQALVVSALENETWDAIGFGEYPEALAAHLNYLASAARTSLLVAPADARAHWDRHRHRRRKGTALGRPEWCYDPEYHYRSQVEMIRYRPERYTKEFEIPWPL